MWQSAWPHSDRTAPASDADPCRKRRRRRAILLGSVLAIFALDRLFLFEGATLWTALGSAAALAVVLLATATVRFCPIYHGLGLRTCQDRSALDFKYRLGGYPVMNATRTLLVLLTLTATVLAGCTTADYESLTVHDWKAEYESTPDAFLLDVRTVSEYGEAHLEGATLIPVDELQDNAGMLPEDKDTPIFVYCRSGNRSGTASGYLVDMGYTHVVNLEGGINDWIGAGYPVVQG